MKVTSMMDATAPPSSRQELVERYCAAVERGDWKAMATARQDLAVLPEYEVAMGIRHAQAALAAATTRLTAAQTELDRGEQALTDARDRAPLAAEQASLPADPRTQARLVATAAHWRDVLPTLVEAVARAEARYRDNAQAVAEARAYLSRLLAEARDRVRS